MNERETETQPVFTGSSFKACTMNGEGFLMGTTQAAHPCGCRIKGNGTLPHPLEIVFCDFHKLAQKCLVGISNTIENILDSDEINCPSDVGEPLTVIQTAAQLVLGKLPVAMRLQQR